jgi:hypothetical protein
MPKSKNNLANKQITDILNPTIKLEGGMNIGIKIKNLISESLKKCPYSRHGIVVRMSEITGKEITYHALNSWTAESKDQHRFPAEFLSAFCQATGDYSILKLIANAAGGYFIEGKEAIYTRLGRIQAEESRLQKEKQEIQKQLQRIEKGEIEFK